MATPIEQRAVKAQQKLADSADTLVDSAETQEDSASRRTRLAANRTLLAAERTYAAWMRTGLAGLASGIGAKALLDKHVPPWMVLATSVALILFAEFCFLAAIWRELAGRPLRPAPDTANLPAWLLVVFNGFLLVVGAAVLIGIVTD
jgi:putative membrane protein